MGILKSIKKFFTFKKVKKQPKKSVRKVKKQSKKSVRKVKKNKRTIKKTKKSDTIVRISVKR